LRRRIARPGSALALILVATIAAVSPPVVANAVGGPATNYRTQLLDEHPKDNAEFPTATVSRDIYLDRAVYQWTVDIGTETECATVCPARAVRYIKVAKGSYHWNCYLDPRNDFYVEWCTLNMEGSPEAVLEASHVALRASGTRTWGGHLVWYETWP
jgi:hypothetical protein